MGDDERGQAELVAQPKEQGQDLAADGGVQRRHRLVGHDHLGIQDQRTGDHDTLALATGELVRGAQVEALGRAKSGSGEGVRDPLGLVGDVAMDPQALRDGLVHSVPGG